MYEQVIYFGAPGTGKSFEVKERIKHVSDHKVFRVTIHPEYAYSDFIGQVLPGMVSGSPGFYFQPGPFTQALKEAYDDLSEDVYLVLEELSRGNVAGIFGDVFQLLDRDAHFESRYPVRNKYIADEIPSLIDDQIKLPSNFNILCTVNTNDQNVFPMDTAFKRRFAWKYVSTAPAVDVSTGTIDSKLNNAKLTIAIDGNRLNDIQTNWQSFYCALNDFITNREKGLGRKEDKQVGQFFIEFSDDTINDSYSTDPTKASAAKDEIDNIVRNKLLHYLWQDVQGSGSFRETSSVFDTSIMSYGDLYNKYGEEKVFSDTFLNDFLVPNASKYPY